MCAFQKRTNFSSFLVETVPQEGGIFCLHPQTSLSTFHFMDQSLLLEDFEAVAMYQVHSAIWQRQTWSQAKQWLRSYIHIKLASWPSHYNKKDGGRRKEKRSITELWYIKKNGRWKVLSGCCSAIRPLLGNQLQDKWSKFHRPTQRHPPAKHPRQQSLIYLRRDTCPCASRAPLLPDRYRHPSEWSSMEIAR